MSQQAVTKEFGWGWGGLLLHLFQLGMLGMALLVTAFAIVIFSSFSVDGPWLDPELVILLRIMVGLYIFCFGLNLLTLILLFMRLFHTRVRVSPEGLEYCSPLMRQHARWSDVQRRGVKARLGFAAEVLFLRQSEITGQRLMMAWWRALGGRPTFMDLNYMRGWPEGELAEAISAYAPHLIEASDQMVAPAQPLGNNQ